MVIRHNPIKKSNKREYIIIEMIFWMRRTETVKTGVGTRQRKQLIIDRLRKPSGHRQKARVAIKGRINGLSERPAAGRGSTLNQSRSKM